jgi:hypothetical protein
MIFPTIQSIKVTQSPHQHVMTVKSSRCHRWMILVIPKRALISIDICEVYESLICDYMVTLQQFLSFITHAHLAR